MSTITEKLKWLVTADATSAIKAFDATGKAADKNLKTAEDRSQKLGGTLTKVGAGAMASAGLIGGALFKAAGAFEDLAIASGKMADATGLSVDEASRWIEVAGDMGISMETVQTSLGKMNKTLGATPAVFADLDIPIATTKDGLTDVNGTFLNTIARLQEMKDPAERAAAAAKIFGKGWQGAAELLNLSTSDIKTQLASVSDQKVINEDELSKAKDYRASLDSLKDSAEDLGIAIGQGAAPVISALAGGLATAMNLFGKLDAVTSGAAGEFAAFATIGLGVVGTMSVVAGQLIKMKTNLAGIGSAAAKASAGLAVVGVTAFALYQRSQHAADALERIAHNAEELGRVADKDVLDTLNMSLAQGLANGVSMADTMKLLAQTNLDGAKRALEMADAQDHHGVVTVALRRAIVDEIAAEKQATTTHDEFGESTEDVTTKTEGLTIVQGAAKGAVTALKDATEEAKRKSDLFADSLQRQRDKLDALYPKEYDAVTAKYDYADAQAAAMIAIDGLNTTLGDNKSKQEDVDTATRNARDAILDQSEKYATLDGAAAGSSGAIRRQITSLEATRDTLAPGSPLRIFLDQYIADLKEIPEQVDTYANLHISSDATNKNAPGYGRAGERRASGGPVDADHAYLVGEHGMELFVPQDDGTIIDARQTGTIRGNYSATANAAAAAAASRGNNSATANAAAAAAASRASRGNYSATANAAAAAAAAAAAGPQGTGGIWQGPNGIDPWGQRGVVFSGDDQPQSAGYGGYGGGGGGGGGGDSYFNLTINAGLGTDGYAVAVVIVNWLGEYDRRNGTHIVTPVGR